MSSPAEFWSNADGGWALSGGCDGAHIRHGRVGYDLEEERLGFFTAEGVLLVQCGISITAVAALGDYAIILHKQP
jgi:hypothetical protein